MGVVKTARNQWQIYEQVNREGEAVSRKSEGSKVCSQLRQGH